MRFVPRGIPSGLTSGRRVAAHTSPVRAARRARIILLAADGVPSRQISVTVGMHESNVAKWRNRFRDKGLDGLEDSPRPGGPRRFGHDERIALAAAATSERDPDDPVATWTYFELAQKLWAEGVQISVSQLWRILTGMDIRLDRVRGWLNRRDDPTFWDLNPPERALVVHSGTVVGKPIGHNNSATFCEFLDQIDRSTRLWPSTSSSITAPATSRKRPKRGSPTITAGSCTTRRPTPVGSTRSNCSSPSCNARSSATATSPHKKTSSPNSSPSSATTTRPQDPLSGPTPATPSKSLTTTNHRCGIQARQHQGRRSRYTSAGFWAQRGSRSAAVASSRSVERLNSRHCSSEARWARATAVA